MTNLFFKPMLWGLLSLFALYSCQTQTAVTEVDTYTLYPDFSMAQEKNQLVLEQVSMRLDAYSQRLLEDPKAATVIAKELEGLRSTVDKQREENQQYKHIKDIIDRARGAIASSSCCFLRLSKSIHFHWNLRKERLSLSQLKLRLYQAVRSG